MLVAFHLKQRLVPKPNFFLVITSFIQSQEACQLLNIIGIWENKTWIMNDFH